MAKPPEPQPEVTNTKAAAIRAMAREGIPAHQIAERLSVSPNHVHSSLSRDRAEGRMPIVRQLKPDAGETLDVWATTSEGLTIPADTLLRLGVEPGQPVVVVQLLEEIRILTREAAAQRICLP